MFIFAAFWVAMLTLGLWRSKMPVGALSFGRSSNPGLFWGGATVYLFMALVCLWISVSI
ncbi:hypothetical protein [Sphingobium yanoikuyae]|jgi:hypothetical protein|uniref:hypothetical protein n=1 Tax=Sphingobium TaxID=165695 RepID=UPI00137822B1|nr:hypothetical protein [Sphingobium yanoikuyae]NBB41999.1 hypothetical protein [Sphingobium yanoikuyae]